MANPRVAENRHRNDDNTDASRSTHAAPILLAFWPSGLPSESITLPRYGAAGEGKRQPGGNQIGPPPGPFTKRLRATRGWAKARPYESLPFKESARRQRRAPSCHSLAEPNHYFRARLVSYWAVVVASFEKTLSTPEALTAVTT